MPTATTHKYLVVPLPKSPYYRIGCSTWQDYYRQVVRTVAIVRNLRKTGNDVIITIISAFQLPGRLSEIEIYTQLLHNLAPELPICSHRETNDTAGQIERSFDIAREMAATPVFVTTWMHYPRVRYLAHGRRAYYYGALGIPQPLSLLTDLFCLIFQPIGDALGVSAFVRRIIIREREQGRIL